MENKETGMSYSGFHKKNHTSFKYFYEPKGTSGEIELWPLSELSQYSSLIFTKHAEERLGERKITKQKIQEFLDSDSIKITWRPNYKTNTGFDARIIGEMKGFGLINVFTANELTEDNELLILSVYQINHSKADLNIYYEGLELLSENVDEQENN